MKTFSQTPVTIPLPQEAHQWAYLFSIKQPSVPLGKQVYLNTLAVYAVYLYLTQQRIETDLEASDSWNPIARSLYNAADLVIPGAGKIECCPVDADATDLELPVMTIGDRIAYVPVMFEESLECVSILGFYSSYDLDLNDPPDEIDFSDTQWQALDRLPQRIEDVAICWRFLTGEDALAQEIRKLAEELTEEDVLLEEVTLQVDRIDHREKPDRKRFAFVNYLKTLQEEEDQSLALKGRGAFGTEMQTASNAAVEERIYDVAKRLFEALKQQKQS